MAIDGLRQDIQDAYDRMNNHFGMKREVKNLEAELLPGEQIIEMTGGMSAESKNGVLVLTNQRIMVFFKGVISRGSEEFRLIDATSIAWKGGIMMGSISLMMSANTISYKNVDKKDGQRFVDAARHALQDVHDHSASAQTFPVVSAADELTKLAALHAQGILTDEEFAAKKHQVLGL
jgi:hypothetical protein